MMISVFQAAYKMKRANTASRKSIGIMQPTWGTRRVIWTFVSAWSFFRFGGESTLPPQVPLKGYNANRWAYRELCDIRKAEQK